MVYGNGLAKWWSFIGEHDYYLSGPLQYNLLSFNSSADIQLQRLMIRDGSNKPDASARLNSQLPITKKLEYADQIIENSGSIAELENEVVAFLNKLDKQVGGWWWLACWLIPPVGLTSAGFTLILRALRSNFRRKKSQ